MPIALTETNLFHHFQWCNPNPKKYIILSKAHPQTNFQQNQKLISSTKLTHEKKKNSETTLNPWKLNSQVTIATTHGDVLEDLQGRVSVKSLDSETIPSYQSLSLLQKCNISINLVEVQSFVVLAPNS